MIKTGRLKLLGHIARMGDNVPCITINSTCQKLSGRKEDLEKHGLRRHRKQMNLGVNSWWKKQSKVRWSEDIIEAKANKGLKHKQKEGDFKTLNL
jgi:hypothetical protein